MSEDLEVSSKLKFICMIQVWKLNIWTFILLAWFTWY